MFKNLLSYNIVFYLCFENNKRGFHKTLTRKHFIRMSNFYVKINIQLNIFQTIKLLRFQYIFIQNIISKTFVPKSFETSKSYRKSLKFQVCSSDVLLIFQVVQINSDKDRIPWKFLVKSSWIFPAIFTIIERSEKDYFKDILELP